MRKELYQKYFDNKKVTVLGLGLLGRGLGDTEFLLNHVKHVICTDTRKEERLAESIREITKNNPPNLTLVIEENRLSDFEHRDFILTCTGMPVDYEYLVHAKNMNIPVYMSASLVSSIVMKELPDVTIIGITGTRGKSTTTQLIAHILRENGLRAHLGGNIRGVANLPLLDDLEDGDYLVLELDSWQLQGFGDMQISPHIAVFTSFLDDHMNYYKNDREAYFNDKANIYRNQSEYDVLIASHQAEQEIHKRDKNQKVFVPEEQIFETSLIGEHNQVSVRLAYEVASQCGLDDESIRGAIKSFKAVEGRLEDMGVYRGVRVINDNNATTEDATVAGIEAVTQKYGVKPILICGGVDKKLSISKLVHAIEHDIKDAVYLSGTGTDTIDLPKAHEFERLEDCISSAFSLAQEGDVILFSPAFASFSKYFNNEYERNDLFVQEVKKYA